MDPQAIRPVPRRDEAGTTRPQQFAGATLHVCLNRHRASTLMRKQQCVCKRKIEISEEYEHAAPKDELQAVRQGILCVAGNPARFLFP